MKRSFHTRKALLALAAASMTLSNVTVAAFAKEESFEEEGTVVSLQDNQTTDEVSVPVAVGESTIKDIKASLAEQKDRLAKETNAAMKEQIQDYIDQLETQLKRYEMVPMYRLYNPNSGEHFYTKDTTERQTLIGIGWKDESVGWYAPVNIGDPVYRLYNGKGRIGEHHYTRNKEERDKLIAAGWKDEGIGWYAPVNIGDPVYRLYNGKGRIGEHHYTRNKEERDKLIAAGWKDEGIGWNSMYTPQEDVNSQPVYRQYNPNEYANNHNYTTSKTENDTLVKLGWKDEGIGWYGLIRYLKQPVDGGFTYFDQEDNKTLAGWNSFDAATFYGWKDEGIGWYGLIRYLKQPVDGGFTYFDQEDNKTLAGWNSFDAATFYMDPNNANKCATGSYQIDGKYYLFNDEGHLQRGNVEYNGERYFLDAGTGQALTGYTLLEPSQADGHYRYVYLDDTGKAVRNQSINGMEFDGNGYKTNLTPDEAIKIEALEVLDSCGHDLGAAFDWTAKNIAYKHYNPEYFAANPGMSREQTYALVGFQQRVGNMYVYSQVYAELAKALGYQAKMVPGYIKTTSGKTEHAWVEIVVDGQKYICDPEMYAKADGFPRNYCYMQPADKTTFVYNPE